MKKKYSNRGFTLVELIGALTILGLVTGLVATTIGIFILSANQSVTSSKIQTEGLLLVRSIENSIIDLRPNQYDTCDSIDSSTCIELKRFISGEDNPIEVLRVELINNELIMTTFDSNSEVSNIRVLNNLTLTSDSMIIPEEVVLDGQRNRFVLTIILAVEDVDLVFQASNMFILRPK